MGGKILFGANLLRPKYRHHDYFNWLNRFIDQTVWPRNCGFIDEKHRSNSEERRERGRMVWGREGEKKISGGVKQRERGGESREGGLEERGK